MHGFVFGQPAHEKAAAGTVADELGVGADVVAFEFADPVVVIEFEHARNFRSLGGNFVHQQLLLEPREPVAIGQRRVVLAVVFAF